MTTPDAPNQIMVSWTGKGKAVASAPISAGEVKAVPATEYVRRDPTVLAELPEVKALIRQVMAAWQMAYDEPDRDTLDKAEADRISALWFAKWMQANHPTDSESAPHHGDCIGENVSCLRCIADDVLGSVDTALARAAAIREARNG